jgi:hypothetical protein
MLGRRLIQACGEMATMVEMEMELERSGRLAIDQPDSREASSRRVSDLNIARAEEITRRNKAPPRRIATYI